MKCLITGGAGFIGKHLANRLRKDHKVLTMDRGHGGDITDDITLAQDLDIRLTGVDVLFHLAANSDIQAGERDLSVDYRDGVLATYRLYRAAKTAGVKRIVFASSSAVYGENTNFPISEYEDLCPISHYGAAKVYGEMLGGTLPIDVVNLRLGNVVGGDVTHGLLYNLRKQSMAHPSHLELMCNGQQFKDWVHVDDVVEAFVLASTHSGGTYNIGGIFDGYGEDGIPCVTVVEIASRIRARFCPGAEIRFLGGDRGWVGDVTQMLLDSSRAEKRLGWTARLSSSEAIDKAIEEML